MSYNIEDLTTLKLSGGTTVNFDSSMTATQIQTLINAQPKDLGGNTLIFQFADGTYTLDAQLNIGSFYSGSLVVQGNTSEFTKATTKSVVLNNASSRIFNMYNCSAQVYVRGMQVTGLPPAAWAGVIQVKNIPTLYINGMSIASTAKSDNNSCIIAEYVNASIYDNYVSNAIYGIFGGWGTQIIVGNNSSTGTSPNYGISVSRGIMIKNDAIVPTGTVADELNSLTIIS